MWVMKGGKRVKIIKRPAKNCIRRKRKVRADNVLHHYKIAQQCRDAFARGEKIRFHHFTHAIPSWCTSEDLRAIKALYAQCRKISKDTGVKHEIDHIIPLRGKNVCGLHVLENLRIMDKKKNRTKGNK